MKHYGLSIAEGSEITNPTIATGTSFPGNESVGELFFRTDQKILYVWDGTEWDNAGGAGLTEVVEDTTPELGGNLDVNDFDILNGTAELDLNDATDSILKAADAATGQQLTVIGGEGTAGTGGQLFLSGGEGSVTGGGTTIRSGDGGTGNAGSIVIQPGSSSSGGGGFIEVKPPPGSSTAPILVLYEAATNGSNGLFLRAPDDTSGIRFWTLPDDDPSVADGQFLTTNSSGVMSFAAALTEVLDDTSPQLGSDLDTNGYKITGSSNVWLDANTGVTGAPVIIEAGDGTGGLGGIIRLRPGKSDSSASADVEIAAPSGSTDAPRLRFQEAGTNGFNTINLQAPTSVTTDRTWTLPEDDPSTASGKFLTTDASGVMSFADATVSPGGSTTQLQYNDSGSFAGDDDLTWNSGGRFLYVGTTGTGYVTSGNGNKLSVRASNSATTTGGQLELKAGTGASTSNGGSMILTAGKGGSTSGDGGALILNSGGADEGDGGELQLNATGGTGTNQRGGAVNINGGDSTGTQTGGNVGIIAGDGGATGVGGQVQLYSGGGGGDAIDGSSLVLGGRTSAGYGGTGTLSAGYASSVNGHGGGLQFVGGAADGIGTGGSLIFSAGSTGAGGAGGDLQLTVGGSSGAGATQGIARLTVNATPAQNTPPEFRFYEADPSGSYIAFKAPDSPSADRTWVWPDDDPATADGKFLTTDASGNWSFDTPETGGAGTFAARMTIYEYTATAGQTTFSGADDNGETLTYNEGEILVYQNGSLLDPDDYTATSGTSVVLHTGASAGHEVNIIRYAMETFSAAQPKLYQYIATAGQTTFSGADENGETLGYTEGELLVFKNGSLLDPTDYTATSGTSVVLDVAASVDDEVNILRFIAVERFNTLKTYRYLLDDGDDTASGTDAKGNTLTYAINLLNVYLNGSKLSEDQYDATDGSSVVLDDAMTSDNNILEITTYSTFTSVDETVARENMIMNGNFNIWQRGTDLTLPDAEYTADRWHLGFNGAVGATFGANQVSAAGVLGSSSAFGLSVDVADATLTGADFIILSQGIEGHDIIRTDFGTSNAKSITLSFKVRSSKTGTYCVSMRNQDGSRSYVAEYTLSTADVYETKVITIPGCTDGTWYFDNTKGLHLDFCLGIGTTYVAAADTWVSSNAVATTNQVNIADSTSNTWDVTQVRLEVGNVASSYVDQSYAEELAKCQRYYCKTYDQDVLAGAVDTNGCLNSISNGGGVINIPLVYPVTMRTTPSITIYSPDTGTSGKLYVSVTGDVTASATRIGHHAARIGVTTTSNTGARAHFIADADF